MTAAMDSDPSKARLIRDEIITVATTDQRAPAAGSALNLPAVADRLRSRAALITKTNEPAPSDIPTITVA